MAPTQYYVDPVINANIGTGTIGNPFGDLQYALNTVTRDTANGDQINIKAGTAELLAATLSLSTYGVPTAGAPLVLRGYTAAADDGGRGIVSGNNGNFTLLQNAVNFLHLRDLRLTNTGSAYVLGYLGNYCSIINCEIDTSASHGLLIAGACVVDSCYVHDVNGHGIYTESGATIVRNCCIVGVASNNGAYGIYLINPACKAHSNLIKLGTNGTGICSLSNGAEIIQNAVIGVNNTGKGIEMSGSSVNSVVANNIVAGFSGSGGRGYSITANSLAIYRSNAAYNNATNYYESYSFAMTSDDNQTLAAAPFTDAANGDFSLTETAKAELRSAGWPTSYLGAHANSNPHVTIGPVQYGPTPTGGGRRPRLWSV